MGDDYEKWNVVIHNVLQEDGGNGIRSQLQSLLLPIIFSSTKESKKKNNSCDIAKVYMPRIIHSSNKARKLSKQVGTNFKGAYHMIIFLIFEFLFSLYSKLHLLTICHNHTCQRFYTSLRWTSWTTESTPNSFSYYFLILIHCSLCVHVIYLR